MSVHIAKTYVNDACKTVHFNQNKLCTLRALLTQRIARTKEVLCALTHASSHVAYVTECTHHNAHNTVLLKYTSPKKTCLFGRGGH